MAYLTTIQNPVYYYRDSVNIFGRTSDPAVLSTVCAAGGVLLKTESEVSGTLTRTNILDACTDATPMVSTSLGGTWTVGIGGSTAPTAAIVSGNLLVTFAGGESHTSQGNVGQSWQGFTNFEIKTRVEYTGNNTGNFIARIFVFYPTVTIFTQTFPNGTVQLSSGGSQTIGLTSGSVWVKMRVDNGIVNAYATSSNSPTPPTTGWIQLNTAVNVGLGNNPEPSSVLFQATNEKGVNLPLPGTISFNNYSRLDLL
jgi:hypothetical protein